MTEVTRRLRLDASASVAELDGEAVVLHLATGQYYRANGTGAFLLRLLAEGSTVSELERAVVDRYGIEPSRAAADVASWVGLLTGRGLLVEDRGQAPTPPPPPPAAP